MLQPDVHACLQLPRAADQDMLLLAAVMHMPAAADREPKAALLRVARAERYPGQPVRR